MHAAGGVKGHVTDACWDRGLLVSTAAAANAEPVAEYTLARSCSRARPPTAWPAPTRDRRAAIDLISEFPRAGNFGKTVGIVGASRIGRRVIELLEPFDLRVLVSDPYLEGSVVARRAARAQRRRQPARPLPPLHPAHARCPPARAAARRRDADQHRPRLARSTTTRSSPSSPSGRIDAVIDVTDPEPLPPDSPLYDLPNVVLTPHVAGALGVEVRRLGASALDELERYARGEPFAHPVTRADLDRIACQKTSGHHGSTSPRNAADALATAPGVSSRTRPAAASERSVVPPRYAAARELTSSSRSAAACVRSQPSADSR